MVREKDNTPSLMCHLRSPSGKQIGPDKCSQERGMQKNTSVNQNSVHVLLSDESNLWKMENGNA